MSRRTALSGITGAAATAVLSRLFHAEGSSVIGRENTELAIIHCAFTPRTHDIGVAEIDQWHRQKGWLSCGYHYVIRRDGQIEIGRELMVAGAHTIGFNNKSVGVCLVGGASADLKRYENNFEDDQMASLEAVLRHIIEVWPDLVVAGHCDVADKRCPGFDVQKWAESKGFSTQQHQSG
tara:strand:+ start:4410 stop:4946 length:537 start_codon:yes stop_codon:yes gene_type:complete